MKNSCDRWATETLVHEIFEQNLLTPKNAIFQVSEDEWLSIPEVGDARNKAKRNPRTERYTPVSDSLLAAAAGYGNNSTTLDARVQSGFMSSMGYQSTVGGFQSTFGGMQSTLGRFSLCFFLSKPVCLSKAIGVWPIVDTKSLDAKDQEFDLQNVMKTLVN